MDAAKREALSSLLRRIDDVRGLAGRPDAGVALDPSDPDHLLATLGELVDELERSHRRLIETNVQLVSLREVASSMVSARDAAETTRTVTRYLSHAFGFPDVLLALADRERRALAGTWTSRRNGREQSVAFEVPLLGDGGAMVRAFWLNRTLWQRDVRRHPIAVLPDGHPLGDVLDGVVAALCVPLQRSQSLVPGEDAHELCGARCILGDTAILVPPPGPAADRWAYEREERQACCLACDLMPQLGVIGIAAHRGERTIANDDGLLLESIALSVAPVVENAKLAQDLRRSERFREHVLDSMASGLIVVDLQGRILTFNHTAEQLLGWSEATLLNRPMSEVLGEEAERLVRGTLEHGRLALRQEVTLRTESGSRLPASLTTSLLRHEGRNVYGTIITFLDLTPLKRAEEQTRRLDRLAALGRFTSSVAHEIRNPLTGIAAGVQYLSRALGGDGPQRENLQFIENEIRRLDRIVQDLFDVTHPRKLQARVLPLEDTLARALRCVEVACAERGVTVESSVAPRTPPVPHDPDQLEQVFINLLKNAAEASPSGGVIRVSVQPAPASGGLAGPAVSVRICDQGPGIQPEHLKTVFEPFFTTKQGGSGLGLYISHDIVKRHGGNLTVHNEPARGATFVVELPLAPDGGQS
ncbi:MAG TPA: ATP-binding protein [Candidatus Sulfotelmatobacter sp.]|nr:ATP-binding protein [Candidatus Sulfotelmatobacter sp.]